MSIIEKMNDSYQHMSETEKIIYHYILQNKVMFSLQSINDVAKQLNISPTSLVRFAKLLGFSRYTLFKKQLQHEQILTSTPQMRLKHLQESNYLNRQTHILEQEMESLKDVMASLSVEHYDAFIGALLKEKKVVCMAWNEAVFLANVFSYRLRRLGNDVRIISRVESDFDEELLLVEPNSLLVVFDFYPYCKAIDLALQQVAGNHRIALITDYEVCPLLKYADMYFFTPSKTDVLINSLSAANFFINLVMSSLFEKIDNNGIQLIEKRDTIRKKSKEYFNG